MSNFSLSKTQENPTMSLVPGIPNPYLAAFGTGLLYGLAFCTSACLPYIACYIAGVGAGFRRSILIALSYNSGRIAAYAIVGGVIGALGGIFRIVVSETSLAPFQGYSSIAFGIVTIIIGAHIILKSRSNECEFQENVEKNQPNKIAKRFDIRAFSLGLSRGLVICPALIALLVYSLAFATPIDSLLLAILFGLGTALSPLLLLAGATGWLLNKAPLFRKWIALLGGAILIILGSGTLLTTLMAKYP